MVVRVAASLSAETTDAGLVILSLNLVGTFAFGLSGGLAAVRARLDIFGVVALACVVAMAGGIIRDVLIGVPPETFRDWRYLAAAGAAGAACFFARPAMDRFQGGIQAFDALGLALFCVAGATKAFAYDLGPAQGVVLGAITGIGGGVLRDVLLRQVPTVLRSELYAIPAVLGATVVAVGHAAGSDNVAFSIAGAALCFGARMVGIRFGLHAPVAPSMREHPPE